MSPLKKLYLFLKKEEEGLQLKDPKLEKELKALFLNLNLETQDQDSSFEKNALEKIARLGEGASLPLSVEQYFSLLVPVERALQVHPKDSDILVFKEDRQNKIKKNELVFVLDNIRSAFNLGAILRTADALGVSKILATGYSPLSTHEKVKKSSMGAFEKVEYQKVSDLKAACESLKAEDYFLVAAELASNAQNIYRSELPLKSAFVFGNERFGVLEKDLALMDLVVELPMCGYKNSLNINAAAAACGYEWLRQNGKF